MGCPLNLFARIALAQMLSDERRQRVPRRLAPTDAEGMPGGVGVHLVTFVSIEIRSFLKQSGTERNSLGMRSARVLDVEVEMYLLVGVAMRPIGRDMVRCQLYADPPFSSGVDNAVPLLVLEDMTVEHASPERALRVQVGCVENDHLTNHLHAVDTSWMPESYRRHRRGSPGSRTPRRAPPVVEGDT